MAVEHVKSTPVTNADAQPPVANTVGEGAPGSLREVSGFVTVPASSSVDSTFRFVRVPTNAVIKAVVITSVDQGSSGDVDIGVYYPTTGRTATADLAANAIDQDFFASAVDINAAALAPTDVTFEAGAGYTRSEWNTPLWEALGLPSDPGGEGFDIVGTLTEAVDTGGVLAVSVRYVL